MKSPFRPTLTVLILCALLLPQLVLAQEPSSATDLSSPRATVRTFVAAMSRVRQGDNSSLQEALTCLYLEDEPEEGRTAKGAQLADQLFDVLDTLTFKLEDIPEVVDGDNYSGTIGTDERQVPIVIHRNEDNSWRFSYSQMLANLEDLVEEIVEEVAEEKEEAAVGFVPDLASPRKTMALFFKGMNAEEEGGIKDAIRTLDLSGVSERMKDTVARESVFQLIDTLNRYKYIFLPEIPDESIGSPYVLLRHDVGNIVIDVTTDVDTQEKAWKFTAATIEKLPALYDEYRSREAVVETDTGIAKPLSLRLRDWIASGLDDYAPALRKKLFGLEIWQSLGLLVIIFFGMAVSRLMAFAIAALLRGLFARQELSLNTKLEGDFNRPIRIAFMSWVWLLGLSTLGLPPNVLDILRTAAILVTAAGLVWAVYKLVDILGGYLHERALKTENKFDDLLAPLVSRTLKVFVIAIGIVVIVKAIGKDPVEFLAFLGLGGLAFALAARETVANIFGSITILMDRPFQIGDWVVISGQEGTVEKVGVRSTRIRTFYNSLITVPNSEMITATVDNYGARRYRRIKTTLGIAYETPPEKIEAFCEGIRQLILEHPYTRKDYYHVYFNQFEASSLGILLYCFLETPDWSTELRERHRLFLDIMRLARSMGVEFAYPTQTLHVAQPDGAEADFVVPQATQDARESGRKIARKIASENLTHGKGKPPPVTFPFEGSTADSPSESEHE